MKSSIAELLRPLLPEGLTPETLRRRKPAIEEALDPLARLATRRSERSLGLGKVVITPNAYKQVRATQAALRSSYSRGLDDLLARAEEMGPRGRDSILRDYQRLAYAHLKKSHLLGMKVSAAKSGQSIDDSIWDRYLSERANHDKLHFADFLSAIWEGREVMDRKDRKSLYVDNLDAMFHQGALAGTSDEVSVFWKLSPAEHCMDCITLAANAPYSKPGVDFGDLPKLPTVPRRGDTECLARCKCFLTFIAEKGERVDPEDSEGSTAVDEDGDLLDDETLASEEYLEASKEADRLTEEMQYAKAMHELTGDEEWIGKRRDANARLIELQEETGWNFIPNAPSDRMLTLAQEAQAEGWTVGLAADAPKFTQGQFAGAVHGAEFSRGRLIEWDPEAGRGVLEAIDGTKIPVGTANEVPTILFGRKLPDIPARPWAIESPTPRGIAYDLPGRSNAIVEIPAGEAPNPDLTSTFQATTQALKARPQVESHGLNVWIMGLKERMSPLDPDTRLGFGRGGVEIVPEYDAIALRGANRGAVNPEAVRDAVWLGMGARLFRGLPSGRTREFARLFTEHRDFLEGSGMRLFVNGTPEEQGFGALYKAFVSAPAKLKARSRPLFDFIEDAIEDAVTA